jgi:hypothetical protein
MKLPRKPKQWLSEIQHAVDAVYLELEKHEQGGKKQFEAVLDVVIGRIAERRGIEPAKIGEKTGEIVEALGEYLKSVPQEKRDWAGIVTFLYVKYHQVLDLVNEQEMAGILISKDQELHKS